jgi:hypothetical protein
MSSASARGPAVPATAEDAAAGDVLGSTVGVGTGSLAVGGGGVLAGYGSMRPRLHLHIYSNCLLPPRSVRCGQTPVVLLAPAATGASDTRSISRSRMAANQAE